METPGLLLNQYTVFADLHGLSVVPLIRRYTLDIAMSVKLLIPVHKICNSQASSKREIGRPSSRHTGWRWDAQLLGNLRHALACWLTHPPSHISPLLRRSLRLDRLAVTTHCSAPSSPLVVGCGRAGVAPSFRAEGAPRNSTTSSPSIFCQSVA